MQRQRVVHDVTIAVCVLHRTSVGVVPVVSVAGSGCGDAAPCSAAAATVLAMTID